MSKTNVYQFYTELPTWAKGVVIVGGLALTAMAGIGILNRIRKDAQQKDSKEAVLSAEAELKDTVKKMPASYADSQYKGWAQQIQGQFDGCDFSSTLKVGKLIVASQSFVLLNNIIKKLNNNTDWLKLVTAYGIRTYDQCGWRTGEFTGDLYKAIQDELNKDEIEELNTTLKSRNITYKI